MSASTQTSEQTNGGAPARRKRGPNKKAAAKRKAPAVTATPSRIIPTPERATAMSQRASAPASNNIASGYAAALMTAGPSWSAEYQKTFLTGLTAALPIICDPTGGVVAKAA